MKLFGFEFTITKAPRSLSPVAPGSGGWLPLIREPFTTAWQQNQEIRADTVLGHPTMFRCITLISADVAKLRPMLMEFDAAGIGREFDSPAFSPVLRRPNRYQNRIQFFANWMESKLIHGNTYVLKGRDQRSVVTSMIVLDPTRVTVLVAEDGSVWYQLHRDDRAHGLRERASEIITVPASEIIHDRYTATWTHPLIGISPIRAAAIAAMTGLKIQDQSGAFFGSGSTPGSLLVAPTGISQEEAQEMMRVWDERFGPNGTRRGQVAVIGGDMKYTPLTMSAVDSQLVEQLKWGAETVAGVFGVPLHKLGIGQPPTYNNIEALNAQYYSDCLQIHIESIEAGLDDGMGLGLSFGNTYGIKFDLDALLRMDTATKVRASAEAIKAGFMAPNEARAKFDLKPVDGGDSPYMQQQQFSLAALAERDEAKPFAKPARPAPALPAETPANGDSADASDDADDAGAATRAALAQEWLRRSQAHYVRSDS